MTSPTDRDPAAFVRPARVDRLDQPDAPAVTGPRWSARFQAAVMALTAVLLAVTAYDLVRRLSGGAVGATLALVAESAFLGLYAVGLVWIVLIGRSLRAAGRPGSHLRQPAVAAFMAMPLVLCATNLYANDAGRDVFNRPEANFTGYAITACLIRIALAAVIAALAVAVRRSTDRLLSA